jgi:hypothetical protein
VLHRAAHVVAARAREEGTAAAWGGPAVAVAAVLYYTRQAWGGRSAAGDDVMAHLVRANWGIDHLWLHGHLDGFLPAFAAGYQEFLFYGQGFTALLALVRLVTFGQLSTAGAMKVVTIASLAAFPLGVAFLARSLGLTRRAAGIAAVLSLLVNNPFGVGLTAVFGPALVPQQVAAILACFCIGAVLRTLAAPELRWTVLAAVTAALIVVTHLITVFIVLALLAVIVPALLLTDRPTRATAAHLAVAGAGAAGLSAFWLVPFIAHRNMHGPVTTWATPSLASRFQAIMHGDYLLRPHVAAVVLIGGAFAVVRVGRGRRWAVALVLAPPGFLVLCRLALHRYPGNEIAVQLENRGIGLAAVIATFGLAAMLAWGTRRAGTTGDVIGVGLAVYLLVATFGPWKSIAAQQPVPSAGLKDAAAEVARVVPAAGRFAEVRQYPDDVNASGGVQHPDFWLAWESGRDSLNEFNVESTRAVEPAFVPEHLLDNTPAEDASDLARLGVSAVVATNPKAAAYLEASPRLQPIWAEDGWTVLSVAGVAGYPAPASFLSTAGPATATRSGPPDHLRLVVDAPAATPATLAVAWSPRWVATVNGRRVPARATADGIVSVTVPAGRSVITLAWSGDPWAGVGLLISALTVLVAGLLLASARLGAPVRWGVVATPPVRP